jgi:hypothetical protein
MTSSALTIGALAPESRAATAAKNPFIVSPLFDGFFFIGSVSAVAVAWLASSRFHVNSFYILAAVATVSNGPHLASTWTRVYFDRREWSRRPIKIFLVPLLIASVVVGFNLWHGPGVRILNSALLYWATWHFLAQDWGLLRLYQRRSSESETSLALRLEKPILYISVLWCLLHRIKTGPRTLFGTEVITLIPTWPVVHAVLAVTIGLAALYLALRIQEGFGAAWVRVLFLLSAFLGFAIPFLFITEDGTTAFAAAACWHGLQYLGIVRYYHRNTWKAGVSPQARVISWASQPGRLRLFLYACLLWALAGVGFLVIWSGAFLTRGTAWTIDTWGGVTWLSFTFSHYYLDGVIWKVRRDPALATSLGVTA